jgi:hypothetical protein
MACIKLSYRKWYYRSSDNSNTSKEINGLPEKKEIL